MRSPTRYSSRQFSFRRIQFPISLPLGMLCVGDKTWKNAIQKKRTENKFMKISRSKGNSRNSRIFPKTCFSSLSREFSSLSPSSMSAAQQHTKHTNFLSVRRTHEDTTERSLVALGEWEKSSSAQCADATIIMRKSC